jgi:hypothetical protein
LENGSAVTEELAAQKAGASEVRACAWLAKGATRGAATRSIRVSLDFIVGCLGDGETCGLVS